MSDGNPPASGEFVPGATLAGYRLDGIVGRGGMAVVYRAFDGRLQRRVALKVLAPQLVRDEEFRQRFIRESRAAAAVDHPNILPIFEAGEADGMLFIAMRYVRGGDVRTVIDEGGPLPLARACAIVAQVAAALDVAHAHGLVHRDVKPANMLREATSYAGQPDHVYLADFGLSKRSVASADLTAHGHFLGTLNYVAPEQIEGRAVDGRTDLYALACSVFEMLGGQPPFKRDDNMAIMWAQVNAAPPPVTRLRHDLPAAVDEVLGQALAKQPGDRYVTCLEFAAALASGCGLRTAGPQLASPPAAPPPAASQPPASQPLSPSPAPGPGRLLGRRQHNEPGRPETSDRPGAQPSAPPVWVPRATPAAPPGRPGPPAMPAPGRQQDRQAPGGGPRRPWLATRAAATVVAAVVAVLGTTGGYLLLNRGGTAHAHQAARGTHAAHDTGASSPPPHPAVVIRPPGCTTKAAVAGTLRKLSSHQVPVGTQPFDVVVTGTGYAFVSEKDGIEVLSTARAVPRPLRTVPLASAQGEALTPDGRYLVVAAGTGLAVFSASALEHGTPSPVGSLSSRGGIHAVEVALSPGGKFAFVSRQESHDVAVFNLGRALASGFGAADVVGTIRLGTDPVGVTVAPDGRYLYVASGLARPAATSGARGTLTVVDVAKAETSPRSSVLKTITAGCGPDRMVISPDGRHLWLTAGGGNALLAYSTAALVTDPRHALVAKVAVGELPLGLAFVHGGALLAVADSNRDQLPQASSNLAVVDVKKALAGQRGALLGLVRSGAAPRQFALEPNGTTLLVTDTQSNQVQTLNIAHLP